MVRDIDAKTAIDAFKAGKARIIDVRQPIEHAAIQVPGSELHPLGQFNPATLALRPGEQIILLCASGGRSAAACQRFAGQAVEAYSLRGGIGAWRAAGGPVESKGGLASLVSRPLVILALMVLAGLAIATLR